MTIRHLRATLPSPSHQLTATPAPPPRSALDTRLAMVAQLACGLAEGADMRVEFHDTQWAWNPTQRVLRVGRDDLTNQSLPYCAALVAHEIGHCAISRYLELRQVATPAQLPSRLWEELLNVLEDPRVEGWMMQAFPGTRAWFADLHATEQALASPASLPSWTLQFFLAALHEWHRGWDTGPTAWEDPAPDDTHRLRLAPAVTHALDATRAARRAYAEHWPDATELGRPTRETHILANAESALPYAMAVAAALEALREAELVSLAGKLAASPQLREGVAAIVAKQSQEEATPAFAALHQAAQGDAAGSDADLETVRQLRALAETRQSKKGRVRTFVVRAGAGEMVADGARGLERGAGAGATRRHERGQRPVRPPLADRKRVLESLRRGLGNLFPPVQSYAWTREHPSGGRVDLRKAMQLQANPNVALQLWQRRAQPQRPDAAVLLLVDLSGSMSRDRRVDAAVLATSTCTQVMSELGVPCAIYGFQDELIPIADFAESWSLALDRRIGEMALEVQECRPGGHNRPGHNDDGPCLLAAADLLAKRPERNLVLLVVSDGRPAGRHSTAADLHRAVAQIAGLRRVTLAAIGIGEGTRHVERFYPDAVGGVPVPEFPRTLGQTLAQRLRAGARRLA